MIDKNMIDNQIYNKYRIMKILLLVVILLCGVMNYQTDSSKKSRSRHRHRHKSRSGKTRDELMADNRIKIVEDLLLNVYQDG